MATRWEYRWLAMWARGHDVSFGEPVEQMEALVASSEEALQEAGLEGWEAVAVQAIHPAKPQGGGPVLPRREVLLKRPLED